VEILAGKGNYLFLSSAYLSPFEIIQNTSQTHITTLQKKYFKMCKGNVVHVGTIEIITSIPEKYIKNLSVFILLLSAKSSNQRLLKKVRLY
jgi:hypothetical protein